MYSLHGGNNLELGNIVYDYLTNKISDGLVYI